jgi:hypothetical protein
MTRAHTRVLLTKPRQTSCEFPTALSQVLPRASCAGERRNAFRENRAGISFRSIPGFPTRRVVS